MSSSPENLPPLVTAHDKDDTIDAKTRIDSPHMNDIEKMLAAKAKEDPLHVTKEDAARLESVEHKALGYRPPSSSVAAQVQAMADKVENFHKIADNIEQKLREHPSSVTKQDAQQVLSKEHKVLGHYPPKSSISAAAQRVAAANERQAKKDEVTKDEVTKDEVTKDEATKDEATKDEDGTKTDSEKNDADKKSDTSKDDASKDDGAKSTTASDATETAATRRMSSVDKAKIDQFKAKAFDVVIREAKDAFQKELEEEFSKTGEAMSVDKEAANKVMAEKTEAIESEKAEVEDVTAVPANGHVKKAE
ncbi:uncharacterized protein IWZ02DRAFT_249570 [Phyllosticta citriasiana]|uniref:Uncharacterized protein n=1 Tax=Phyllosticta citriasiana TaxID=595635 RepID=A0ABR1KTW8_9PEZI